MTDVSDRLLTTRPEQLQAVPLAGNADHWCRQMQERKRTFMLEALGLLSPQIPADLRGIADGVAALDPMERWSPGIHAGAWWLGRIRDGLSIEALLGALVGLERTLDEPYIDAVTIETVGTEPWEQTFLAEMRAYEPTDRLGRSTLVIPILRGDLRGHARQAEQAWAFLLDRTGPFSTECTRLTTHIRLFDGRVLRGETANKVFGAMYLRVPPVQHANVAYWIEHISHEVSHLYLESILCTLGAPCTNPTTERFPPPIRRDPRPMIGIFHATFVLARMVRILRLATDDGLDGAADRLEVVRSQYAHGAATIREHARLTEIGAALVEGFDECAEGTLVP